jgi:HPt (histidine-containing phosphotransfer) domain-containing protein
MPHSRIPTDLNEAIVLLVEELDRETVRELIAQFLNETPVQIEAMDVALGRHDFASLGRFAHSVAGSSSTFGLQEVRSAALLVEEAAFKSDPAQVSARILDLSATYYRVVPDLQKAME